MLEAQLKGKLSREQENLEDILTSNVFGSFKYVPAQDGLLPFISLAEMPDREKLPGSFSAVAVEPIYHFWPSLHEPECEFCEPDVLIELVHDDRSKSLVVIEAKYHSGKSSFADEDDKFMVKPPTDQLAKEWHNLLCMAGERYRPYLIYVTADYACPREDIQASQDELRKKLGQEGEIYWLSWRLIKKALAGTSHPIMQDLLELMEKRYELTTFEKLEIQASLGCNWLFKEEQIRLGWKSYPNVCPWRFNPGIPVKFIWTRDSDQPIPWRYES